MSQAFTKKTAFTIVELIVVIAVIGILATISVISYGGWRTSTATNQLKSDLTNAAAAMERDRSFGEGYPTALPSNFNPSEGVTISYSTGDARSYCLDGVVAGTSIALYIDNQTSSSGPQEGTCSGRPVTTPPATSPTLTRGTQSNVSIAFTWTAVTGASTYTLQCSTDDAFVSGMVENTAFSGTSGTLTGLSPSTGYFCRIKAVNSYGSSNWSSTVTGTTTAIATPASLTLTAVSGTQINATWPSVVGADNYTLQMSTSSGFGTIANQWSGITATSASATNLSINTRYYFRVKATNATTTLDSGWRTSNVYTLNISGSLAVGTSIEGYFTSAPEGFLFEEGQEVSRTTYADLFAVVGTTYGAGNGTTTFNVPDSRGRTAVNRLTSSSNFATLGQESGTKTVTLALANLPSHNHIRYAGGRDDLNFTGWQIAGQVGPADGPGAHSNGQTTGNTGGGAAHNNIQPSIVKRFAIKFRPPDPDENTIPVGGSIRGYWSVAPEDYLLEDGSAVSRTTYATLFAAIGTTYGAGNGSTTFNLPDSRGRASVNIDSGDVEFDTIGEKYGTETEALSVSEMPAHTHSVPVGQIDDRNFTGYATATQYPPGDAAGQIDAGLLTGSQGSGQSFTNVQPSIVQMGAIKYTSGSASGDPVPVGTSVGGYFASVPSGYLYENGAAVSRTTYADLFSVIGTTYGVGNGSTTFNLPDSRGRIGVNLSSSDAEFNTMGEFYGEKTHLLTIPEMPSHNHSLTIGQIDDQNFTSSPGQHPPSDGPGAYDNGTTTGSRGGGQAFNKIQPTIVKRFVIKF